MASVKQMTDINRSQQAGAGGAGWRSKPRRAFSIEQKHELIQLCLQPEASVARIARDHDINANQLFKWRRLYLRGQLGAGRDEEPRLIPVVVGDEPAPAHGAPLTPALACAAPLAPVRDATEPGSIEIELAGARIVVRGAVRLEALRCVVQALFQR